MNGGGKGLGSFLVEVSMTNDVVTAGPRFAVTGGAGPLAGAGEDDDGLVQLPCRFEYRGASLPVGS